MNKQRSNLLTKLQTNLVEFFDELCSVYPTESDFIMARVFIKDQIPIQETMNYIITSLLPLHEHVRKRNDKFFLENNILFSQMSNSHVNRFSELWKSKDTDEHTKNTIWAWIDTILIIAQKYYDLDRNQ
jgi:hypothetical protein